MTFREWLFRCEPCDKIFGEWLWDYDVDTYTCPACSGSVDLYYQPTGKAPGLITDEIPGGVTIRHLSTKPEVFYSKTDIKRRANEKGFVWDGDTPKPYKVPWSGKRTSHDERKNNETT